MKKRLMCLALCAIMLMSSLLFAGCSSKTDDATDDIGEEASRNTTTLNMLVMVEDGTTAESAEAVEEAFNKITKSQFKTAVNIIFATEDEYYSILEASFKNKEEEAELAEAALKALKRYRKEQKEYYKENDLQYVQADVDKKFYQEHPEYAKYEETTVDPNAETTAEETYYNEESGIIELKYPEADPNIIDIFYVGGYDRLCDYIDKEWVSRIDNELTSSAKKLKDYINGVFFDSVKIGGATYAIPNNRTIGEYTYMLLNKELLQKYYYNVDDIKNLKDCKDFLEDIAEFEKDVVPIDGVPEVYNVLYWNFDADTLELNDDEFSVVGTTYNVNDTLGIELQFSSLFAQKADYKEQLLCNKLYEERGYYKNNVAADATCAVKIIKGGAELEKIYGEEYEMVVLETPRANQNMIFEHMFAVGGYTSSVTRSMEVITYLNTNVELRNLLLYGVEGIHYTLNDDGQVVKNANNGYVMDINKSGNAFIAYTEAGIDSDIWQYGMKQNSDSTIALTLGFTLAEESIDTDIIKNIATLSSETKARLDACKSYEEYEALITELATELKGQNNEYISRYTKSNADENEKNESTPYVILYQWMDSMGFIVEE